MKRIYKYPVTVTDEFALKLPGRAKPLCAKLQNGSPQMWFLVDPEQPVTERVFRVIGTGHPIEDEEADRLKYIDSFLLEGDALVFHLFELLREAP